MSIMPYIVPFSNQQMPYVSDVLVLYFGPILNIKNMSRISQSLFTVQHVMWVQRYTCKSGYAFSLEHHSIYTCESAQKGKPPLKQPMYGQNYIIKM